MGWVGADDSINEVRGIIADRARQYGWQMEVIELTTHSVIRGLLYMTLCITVETIPAVGLIGCTHKGQSALGLLRPELAHQHIHKSFHTQIVLRVIYIVGESVRKW